jgi:hypothetical protein
MKKSIQESSKFLEQKKPKENWSYNVKMFLFLLVSLLVILHVMTPSRKVPRRR